MNALQLKRNYQGHLAMSRNQTNNLSCDEYCLHLFASSAVDFGFEPRSDQTKDYKIGMCCFSAEHVAFRRNCKD
jgi:hypothetical protein